MSLFAGDVAANQLPEYTFIEPNYDTGNNYQGGNSMHPLNDIRKGELLIKQVYETLRASSYPMLFPTGTPSGPRSPRFSLRLG
jgi:hypothetical protein